MKKLFILLPLLGMLSYVIFSSSAITGPGGMTPSVERTGASGGAVGCGTTSAGCHSNTASATLTATVSLLSGSTPVTSYTPGASYTIAVGAPVSSSCPKFGFQMAAMKLGSTTINAGAFMPIAGTHTVTPGGTGVIVVEHVGSAMSPTSGFYIANIPWTAPAAGFGPVKVFAVLNTVNFNGSADASDLWDTTTITINEASATVGTISAPSGLNICPNTITPLTCTPAGGTWSSTTPAVGTVSATGVVTGISAGTTTISYDAGTAGVATAIVTVMAAPGAIGGTLSECIGATTTLTCFPSGGSWSSGATTIATVNAMTGIAGGVSSGTVHISYTGSTGCSSTAILTVNANGAATITGTNNVCVGTTITLSNLTPGGTWLSTNPSKATISSAGVVTGVAIGTTTISYTATNSCGTGTTTKTVNVLAAGSCVTGVAPVTNVPVAGLSIYPNPNNGSFTLNLQTDLNEEARVIVCGISGEKVKEFTINTNTPTQMQLPHVAGMYFVSVATSQGNYIGRLVIQ